MDKMNQRRIDQARDSSPVVLTVAALAAQIRGTLEQQYAEVRVRGELTRIFTAQSGHFYGTLRDPDGTAAIDLVLWKGQVRRFASLLSEGAQVEVTGRVSSYAPQSRYQLVVSHVALVGVGALLAELERLKAALAQEGLFDNQRSVPSFPRTVGVVTSPDGAVIEDILHRLRARFPVRVLLWPVLVQGKDAAAQIAQAVTGFSALKTMQSPPCAVPDLILVARGGGSLEDLWAFNEEVVVRAIAASALPVVSAVGHETDTTLADYAADLRAPTPTAAAELITPERAALLSALDEARARQRRAMGRGVQSAQERLRSCLVRLRQGERVLETPRLALDERSARLEVAIRRSRQDAALELEAHTRRLALRAPARRLAEWKAQLTAPQMRLRQAVAEILKRERTQLEATLRLLENLDYRQILARGFALARDSDGRVLRRGQDFSLGKDFRLTVSDSAEVWAETKAVDVSGVGKKDRDKRQGQKIEQKVKRQ